MHLRKIKKDFEITNKNLRFHRILTGLLHIPMGIESDSHGLKFHCKYA